VKNKALKFILLTDYYRTNVLFCLYWAAITFTLIQ